MTASVELFFFHCDHNGRAFEHRDLDADNGVHDDKQYSPHNNEFIHIRYRTKRGFYIWDPESENKTLPKTVMQHFGMIKTGMVAKTV